MILGTRIEVTEIPDLRDSFGESVKNRIKDELGIVVNSVKTVKVYTIDRVPDDSFKKLVSDPIAQLVSDAGLDTGKFDYLIEVGWKPGVTDNTARIAQEAARDIGLPDYGIYSSVQFRISGVEKKDLDRIASELLANPLVQRWNIKSYDEWKEKGSEIIIPRAEIKSAPSVEKIDIMSMGNEELLKLSAERELALNLEEMLAIKDYFSNPFVIEERASVNLGLPTDAELEILGQTWSEHCKHKQFNARIEYINKNGETEIIDSLFKTYIKASTEEIMKTKSWIRSVFWDNAGVMRFNDKWDICLKCETHNSPSNMEGYGGVITGIVGVYRDPMGTGRGGKIILGFYGFVEGLPHYNGKLRPPQHPRVLLSRAIKGVEDGGNRSGIPTPYGLTFFDESYLGKCIMLVAAAGLLPAEINGKPGYEKFVNYDDLIIMAGGRVGIDGIHGATASSRPFDENTPAGHVQIGDPYMQKKLHDLLIEARDQGLINFAQDYGAGGISSSVGETATFCGDRGGCLIDLDNALLKYPNLNDWEILVSESQERMGFAVSPENYSRFKRLAEKHDVEVSILGMFKNSGKMHVVSRENACVYLDMGFLHDGVPQMKLKAKWNPPKIYSEPELPEKTDVEKTLFEMLARPNICSKEYIIRQFDHEVQAGSVIKPLVGKERDVNSDASVLRPVLDTHEGVVIAAGLNPHYSKIDTYHMTAMAIDEAIRRIIAVGGSLEQIALNDNFNWPSPLKDEHKLAQLVEANKALYDYTVAFGTPCISGKDSMSIDGTIKDSEGNSERISGLPLVQFLAMGKIEDTRKCISMDAKRADDLVYVAGKTKDELGASEYYQMIGEVGANVPKVDSQKAKAGYEALSKAVDNRLIASMHGCYKGGLGVALAQTAFAGGLGMDLDLRNLKAEGISRDDKALFSESSSRIVVTIAPGDKEEFEKIMDGTDYALIGKTTHETSLKITGLDGSKIVNAGIYDLKEAWQKPMRW